MQRMLARTSMPPTLLGLVRVAAGIRDPAIPMKIVRAGVRCAVPPSGAMLGLSC